MSKLTGNHIARILLLCGLCLCTGVQAGPAAGEVATDPVSGLVIDEHWELVRAHCSVCHSARLVTQQRASRQTWLQLIRWMQQTQGLWAFDPTTEGQLLDYLERNYAPAVSGRRAPLPASLRPPQRAPASTGE